MMIVSTPRLLAFVCLVPLVNLAPNQETFNIFACIFDIILLLALRLFIHQICILVDISLDTRSDMTAGL